MAPEKSAGADRSKGRQQPRQRAPKVGRPRHPPTPKRGPGPQKPGSGKKLRIEIGQERT
jgi:hypothetical protein